jgi:hypothetical protein
VWLPVTAGENGNVPKCAAGCVGFFLLGVSAVFGVADWLLITVSGFTLSGFAER